MTVDAPPTTATPMEADAAAAAPAAAVAAAAPAADAGAAPAPMEADPPAAAATEKEAAAGGGDKPAADAAAAAPAAPAPDAAAAAAAPADANGAAAASKQSTKSFPRCQLRLRLDSGCYLARMAKDDKDGGEKEREKEKEEDKDKDKANGDVAADGDGKDTVVLLPQEVAAERGWLTDEHAAALERKLVEAASRLGNAAPPLWSLRSERVREIFFSCFSPTSIFPSSASSVGEADDDSVLFPEKAFVGVYIALMSSATGAMGRTRSFLDFARLHPRIKRADEGEIAAGGIAVFFSPSLWPSFFFFPSETSFLSRVLVLLLLCSHPNSTPLTQRNNNAEIKTLTGRRRGPQPRLQAPAHQRNHPQGRRRRLWFGCPPTQEELLGALRLGPGSADWR